MKKLPTLNSDDAMALANDDPDAFEQYRLDAIEALIASANSKKTAVRF